MNGTQIDDFTTQIIRRLEDIGQAKEIIATILELPVFEQISKHDPYWNCEMPEQDKKLKNIRNNITEIQEWIFTLNEVLSHKR